MGSRLGKVVVAMSGGVDSSVAACLLREQGYEVVGLFMRTGVEDTPAVCPPSSPAGRPGHGPGYRVEDDPAHGVLRVGDDSAHGVIRVEDDPARGLCSGEDDSAHGDNLSLPLAASPVADRHRGCCSAADASDARAVAGMLGIPFFALNFKRQFEGIIAHFADEYLRGRTPNPCVLCNEHLKFGRLADYARAVEAEFVATGHYARIEGGDGVWRLRRGLDRAKDQSYVLFGIGRSMLARTLLPIGSLTKEQVREHARRFGLRISEKADSQDICFVPDRDYARVVREHRPEAFVEGPIVDAAGRQLGRHGGVANFTIGQRRGLGVAAGVPIYVTHIDPVSHTVVVGPRDELARADLIAASFRWLIEPPKAPIRAAAQIRYSHEAAPAMVEPIGSDRIRVLFDEPQMAVTPGQAVVLYGGDVVLGGGWIE